MHVGAGKYVSAHVSHLNGENVRVTGASQQPRSQRPTGKRCMWAQASMCQRMSATFKEKMYV